MSSVRGSRNVDKKDSLVYSCTAHNEGNKAAAYIRLSVIGRCDILDTIMCCDDCHLLLK
jgi:hypothetical protein